MLCFSTLKGKGAIYMLCLGLFLPFEIFGEILKHYKKNDKKKNILNLLLRICPFPDLQCQTAKKQFEQMFMSQVCSLITSSKNLS